MTLPPDAGSPDPEKEAILAHFETTFGHFRDLPIALYGLGPNTFYLLRHLTGFHIVGLMDQENTGREIFGLPVLSVEQAAHSAKCIVIVARAAVIPIIYNRVAALAQTHGVAIYDVWGNHLSAPRTAVPSYSRGDQKGEAELLQAIDAADVVSFDIFATLITRKVLRLENVFDLVEQALSRRLVPAVPFKANRILAEQLANERHAAPTIEVIYEELARLLGIPETQQHVMLDEEVATELRLLTARQAMVRTFQYALAKGKTVYLISDMYFGEKILSRILEANGIAGYKKLLVSCGVGVTKRSGGLFRHLLDLEPAGTHLHIGDDPVADVEAPRRMGIRTFLVLSGYEMLVRSPFAHLLSKVSSVSDALALGLFVSRAFNSPFALHEVEGRLVIDNEFDLGYLGYGAILTGFIRWILEKVGGRPKATILFGARDGYLVHKLYARFVESFPLTDAPRGIYFLTSRRAVTVPSIANRQELLNLLNGIPGNPTYGEILLTRFGLTVATPDSRFTKRLDREHFDDMVTFVLEFEPQILENARAERDAYRRYVRSLGLAAEAEIYFFDLITSGTIPHFLGTILGLEPACLCFIVSLPVKRPFAVDPYCYLGQTTPYERSWNFSATHYLTESILTAPHPEFTRMSDDGVPVYGHPEDSHKHFDRVALTHEGIEAYFTEFLSLIGCSDFAPISVELADEINGVLCSENCLVTDALKASYLVSDRYTFSPALNPWGTIASRPSAGPDRDNQRLG